MEQYGGRFNRGAGPHLQGFLAVQGMAEFSTVIVNHFLVMYFAALALVIALEGCFRQRFSLLTGVTVPVAGRALISPVWCVAVPDRIVLAGGVGNLVLLAKRCD